MEVQDTTIPGLKRVIVDAYGDTRGSFREWYSKAKMEASGLPPFDIVQANISDSVIGTLRGIHAEPWEKYIHVSSGQVFAAIVDLRVDSDTFGRVETFVVDETTCLFLPAGFGNSFQVTSPRAQYTYLVSDHWDPSTKYPAVAYDDPDLAIEWPLPVDSALMSSKDLTNPKLRDAFPERFKP